MQYIYSNKAICGRSWILFLDEAKCLLIVERLDAVCRVGLLYNKGASYKAARRGF
jgi:hypothetical protein